MNLSAEGRVDLCISYIFLQYNLIDYETHNTRVYIYPVNYMHLFFPRWSFFRHVSEPKRSVAQSMSVTTSVI